jgi:hypothetical protein
MVHSIAGLSTLGTGFDPSHAPVYFDVDIIVVVMRQGFLRFYPASIISQMLHTDSSITEAM